MSFNTVGDYVYTIRNFYKNPNDPFNIKSLPRFLCPTKSMVVLKGILDTFADFVGSDGFFLYNAAFFFAVSFVSLCMVMAFGLYGILIFNGVLLIYFWVNVVSHMNFFFIEGGSLY